MAREAIRRGAEFSEPVPGLVAHLGRQVWAPEPWAGPLAQRRLPARSVGEPHGSGLEAQVASQQTAQAGPRPGESPAVALEIVAIVDDHMAVDVPLDADFAHPVNRRVRLRHQDFGQLFADPTARNSLQVGMELLRGVSGQMELRESRVIDVGQKLANLVGAGKYPAKTSMGESRIATEFNT